MEAYPAATSLRQRAVASAHLRPNGLPMQMSPGQMSQHHGSFSQAPNGQQHGPASIKPCRLRLNRHRLCLDVRLPGQTYSDPLLHTLHLLHSKSSSVLSTSYCGTRACTMRFDSADAHGLQARASLYGPHAISRGPIAQTLKSNNSAILKKLITIASLSTCRVMP